MPDGARETARRDSVGHADGPRPEWSEVDGHVQRPGRLSRACRGGVAGGPRRRDRAGGPGSPARGDAAMPRHRCEGAHRTPASCGTAATGGDAGPAGRRSAPVNRGAWSRHTTITTAALKTSDVSGGTPIVSTDAVRVWLTIAPTSVPGSEHRPPANHVPPMTTARIASISIHRPALLASAACTFDAIIRPATPAHSALNTYTVQMIVRERTPARRLASGFTPTASMSMPSAVRRVTSATAASTTRLIRIAIGSTT